MVGILICSLAGCTSNGDLPSPRVQEEEWLASWDSGKVTADDLEQFRAYMALGRRGQDVGVGSLALIRILAASEPAREYGKTNAYRRQWLITVADLIEKPLREYFMTRIEVDEDELSRELSLGGLRPAGVRYHVQHIYIRKPVVGGPEARSKSTLVARESANEVFMRAKDGEPFDLLVEAFSESQSRFRNGRINSLLRDFPPELASVIGNLTTGDVSQPVETADGIHVFLCNSRTDIPAQTRSQKRDAVVAKRKRDSFNRALSEDTARELSRILSDGVAYSQMSGEIAIDQTADEKEEQKIARAIAITDRYLESKEAINALVGADVLQIAGDHILSQHALAAEVTLRMDGYSPSIDELRELHGRQQASGARNKTALYDVDVLMLHAEDIDHAQKTQTRAEEVRRALIQGEIDFANAASRYSEYDGASESGRLSGVSSERVAALGIRFSKVLLKSAIGEITPVVEEIPWGSKAREYWIGRLIDVRDEPRKSFSEVRASLTSHALKLHREKLRKTLESELLAKVAFHAN